MEREHQPATVVVLDVDQTLNSGLVKVHLNVYNRELNLGLTAEEIDQANQVYGKTFDVPAIYNFRRGRDLNAPIEKDAEIPFDPENEAEFQRVREIIRTSEEVHLGFNTLPGSIEGARALAARGEISYYTVRPHEVIGATRRWLNKHNFPNPENVVICDSPEDKLKRIIADKLEPHKSDENGLPTVILIDDSFKQLADAAKKIIANDPSMRVYFEHLILVGFGLPEGFQLQGDFYPATGLRTLLLPNWESENLQDIIAQI